MSLNFAAFRAALGAYLAVHFAMLVPYADEVFHAPGGSLVVMAALSVMLAADAWRRPVAVVLWLGWAALLLRNPLISNPGLPYVGWLLLATAAVPRGARCVPRSLQRVGWILLALGYTVSGLHKLTSPSWLDGSALAAVLANPLARVGPVRDVLLAAPPQLLAAMTWGVVALEAAFLLLALNERSRRLAWAAMVAVHTGILLTVSFADLTAGMLLMHWFTCPGRPATMGACLTAANSSSRARSP
jgi:hypothetical protein